MGNTDIFGHRNLAIDMLRGMVMTLMIFVNDSWTVLNVPHWMLHARPDEDFMGLADIVFPCFLFIMGMSIPYGIESRIRKGKGAVGHILLRSLALIVMGAFFVNEYQTAGSRPLFLSLSLIGFFLTWNDYPKDWKRGLVAALRSCGAVLLMVLMISFRSADGGYFSAGWWGILGMLGWAYLVSALIYLALRENMTGLGIALAFFVSMCLLLTPTRSGAAVIELPQPNLFSTIAESLHLRNGCLAALVLGGAATSVVSARLRELPAGKRLAIAFSAALALALAGLLAHKVWIVSKDHETAPWLFWNAAICIAVYSLLRILEDKGKTRLFRFLQPAATATLTAYMVPYLFILCWIMIDPTIPSWLSGWVGQVKCAVYTALCLAVTWGLVKIGIKLKI